MKYIPYPLLFIAAIVLDRVSISSMQIGITQSLRAMLLLLLAASVMLFFIQALIRDWQRANFIVLMIPALLIAYRTLYGMLEKNFPRQADPLGVVLMLAMGFLYAMAVRDKVWKSIRNPRQVTAYFNIVFIVLLIFQVIRLGDEGYRTLSPDSASTRAISELDDPILEKVSSPDIYVIVLDGYARQDVLTSVYGYDNSPFIQELEERGFYVATASHSNNVQTPYSMASFWNFDHLSPWDRTSEYSNYLFEPIQNNRVFRSLDRIGYTTVSFQGAAQFTEIRNADVYLSNFLPLNDFEILLLADSPLEPLSNIFNLKIPTQTYKTHYQRTLYQLDMLKRVPVEISGPKIVYGHILAPHPPFVFDQTGELRTLEQPFTFAEGSSLQGGKVEYWRGYVEQVKFLNTEIVKVIDSILAGSKTPPVIVLMSDHGPGSMFNFDVESPGCLWERVSNFYAVLLPGHQNDGTIYPSITPVNTFRVIFNTYFSTDLPLVEDKSYMMIWYQPTLRADITSQSNSSAGCFMQVE